MDDLTKEYFQELLTNPISKSLVLFNIKYYQQVDKVAMGSLLRSTLANILLCYDDQIWLNNCSIEIKPVACRINVDDKILLIKSREHIKNFQEHLNY